jgi:hypothetical protein
MVAELAMYFVSTIYLLGIVVVCSFIISIVMATISRIITSIVEVFHNER